MELRVRDMRAGDAPACALMACASAIGERYGFEPAKLAATLVAALAAGGAAVGSELFVAELDGRLAGFAWMDPRGAFSTAPYLRLIAVDEGLRGSGVGAALLEAFELRGATVGRDFCLLVSDFNLGAQAFYEKHGYQKAGALPGFAREGITEILMVKRRGASPT